MDVVGSTTKFDVFFRGMCAIVGLNTGFEKRPLLRYTVVIVWIAANVFGMASFILCEFSASDKTSLSFFTNILGMVAYGILVLFIVVQFSVIHEEVESLLGRNGRRAMDFSAPLVSYMSYVIGELHVLHSAIDILSFVSGLYFMLLELGNTAYFLIMYDVIIALQNLQRHILGLSEDIPANQQNILNALWNYRDRVRRINTLFAWSLAGQYLQIFIAAVYSIVQSLENSLNVSALIEFVVSAIGFAFLLFLVAQKSSALRATRLDIEEKILTKDPDRVVRGRILRDMHLVVGLREDWDLLRNGCFALSTGNFLRYLATCVTCTAVTLQFDYRVARLITNTAHNSSMQ